MATKNLGKVVPQKGVDYFTDEDIKSLNIPKNTSDLNNDSEYATENYVKNQIANAQLGGGDTEIDLSGYATKDEIPTKTSQLTNDSDFITSIPSEYITESELNAKNYLTSVPSTYKTKTENDSLYQPKGNYLSSYAESDPTVPSHVKAITQEDINKWNNNNSSGGGGLSTNASNLIVTLFRASLFNSDQTANITALEEELLGNSGTDVTKYTIKNNLTNVVTSNAIGLIVENASYNAILTASDGYAIESVTVIMGDNDITSSAYSNGVINISKVTGNITITAVAIQTGTGGSTNDSYPTNGLMDLFDLRNATPTINSTQGLTSFKSVEGDGVIYTWSGSAFNESNDYGSKWVRGFLYDSNGKTTQSELGTQYTVITLGYTETLGYTYSIGMSLNNLGMVTLRPKYKNTSGNQSDTTAEVYGSRDSGYHAFATVVDGKIMKQYVDGTLAKTWNGDDYETFVSWENKATINSTQTDDSYNTAMLVYNRALTDIELKEVQAYLKTLEVA